jgi:exodeoxyribonuclease V alpha subunit
MAKATGREAKTIHRLLEADPSRAGFRRGTENQLECDTLIIDEISMLDVPLMSSLLEALSPLARLVLVGDSDQLPSVGPGNLLADLIESGVVPVVRLTEIYRQESDSRIITGAYDIIHGALPSFAADGDGDFYFIEQNDPEKVVELVGALVCQRIPERFGFDPFEEIQVLTPMNRGRTGTTHLNETLQEALNPSVGELRRGGCSFRPGDKVMQTRNNYDLDVFNGDIGRVTRVDADALEMDVAYDGSAVRYSSEILDELALAYAITVHKSQGSEFPAVVIPLLTQHYLLLQRNLLYTAVTRGTRLVCIVGSRKALAMAINNDRTQRRNTRLSNRLAAGARELRGRSHN